MDSPTTTHNDDTDETTYEHLDTNSNTFMRGIEELSPTLTDFARDIADRKYVYVVKRQGDNEVILYCESPDTARQIADRHDIEINVERMSHEGTSHIRVEGGDGERRPDYSTLNDGDIVDIEERELVAARIIVFGIFACSIGVGVVVSRVVSKYRE